MSYRKKKEIIALNRAMRKSPSKYPYLTGVTENDNFVSTGVIIKEDGNLFTCSDGVYKVETWRK